jgi:hypothetical protein
VFDARTARPIRVLARRRSCAGTLADSSESGGPVGRQQPADRRSADRRGYARSRCGMLPDQKPQSGQFAPAASQRTVRWMTSSHSCTCSTTSPAPGGNSHCGSTVHLAGGPAIRQAGEVYRKGPASCNSSQQNLDIAPPNQPIRTFPPAVAIACTKFNSHQSHRSGPFRLVKSTRPVIEDRMV